MHGWLIAALLGEMAGHEGEAAFENVESKFPLPKCIRQGSVEAPRLWLEMAVQMLLERGKGMEGNTWVFTLRMNSKTGISFAASCGTTIIGSCHTRQQTKTNDEKLVEEVENGTWDPNQPVL